MAMMNDTYTMNLYNYELMMITAKKLHELNIIDDKDLKLIEEKTAKKYGIKRNSVYRLIDLL